MDGGERIEITVLGGLGEIAAGRLGRLRRRRRRARRVDPFTTHRFLARARGVGLGRPRHRLDAAPPRRPRRAAPPIAVMPLYAKGHSQGEYIFDHNWAHAWERAGGRYYPKLQAAVPFTPATGRRFLTRPGLRGRGPRRAAAGRADAGAERAGVSALHVTFCTARGARLGRGGRPARRAPPSSSTGMNRGYADFDAFLADLASRKRKAIRKERARAQAFGGEIVALTGDALEPGALGRLLALLPGHRRPQVGPALPDPRLLRPGAGDACATTSLLVLARRRGRWVAGALNFIGRDTLYGRYWGCVEDHPFLHFELCYYQAIDWAIAHGLARVEAGAQGEHKLARGYLPVADPFAALDRRRGLRPRRRAVPARRGRAVDQEIEVLTAYGPFRRGAAPEERD